MSYKNEKLSEEKVFKDPVHRYIHVRDKVIWDVIGTSEFQRLRRIRQLGTTYLVFHGAEHSRFHHSLGVYEIVRRIIDDGFQGSPEWNNDERLVALCAALLHDLGHGPFSHAFENVFNLDHEDFTQAILLGDTEVHKVLSRVSPDFPQKVADVIGKTYPDKLVVSLISSQIDADRMDYLQRDAYFTGVSYGHFDMERILRVMRPEEEQAVITYSGMHAVEDYIMSRYQMYWQVYFHPVSRSAEVILTKVLHRAKYLNENGYVFKQEPTHFGSFFDGTFLLEDYIALDEGVVTTYFQMWMKEKDPILADLSSRFINRRLFQYAEFDPATEYKKVFELGKLFQEAGLDPEYYLVTDSSSDLPYDFYRQGEENERLPIFLKMPNGELSELSRSSDIVDAISGKRRTDHKVYFPEDLLEAGKEANPLYSKILHMLKG
ncbi:HD domain-containing protein [Sporosarcina sp. G11-34]|uniref:HD domain-containing protein n=1 Tax=Sporosarcina sp. G11-34 TaxID=2849605 RepID=UPI0022A9411A|nr:HD domain-containing protein [Sporosarcina sp. G11-34]MCZ2257486.1 HD domain-containing protein [Sporosarcina sp. G11-34]